MKRSAFLINIFFVALFFGLIAGRACPAEEEKNGSNIPTSYDFGVVKEGAVLEHRFYVVNNAPRDLNIARVDTSCECVTARAGSSKFLKGGKVPVDVRFDTKGYLGAKTRFIYVNTDSSEEQLFIFEISADVR